MMIFLRYFESGNFRGFMEKKGASIISEKLRIQKEYLLLVPVYTAKDVYLKIEKDGESLFLKEQM